VALYTICRRDLETGVETLLTDILCEANRALLVELVARLNEDAAQERQFRYDLAEIVSEGRGAGSIARAPR